MNRSIEGILLPALLASVLGGCGDDSTGPGTPPQSSRFARSIGGSQCDIANGVAALADGTTLVTGYFDGTAHFHARVALGAASSAASDSLVGAGSWDIFVVKYDAQGALKFARAFGAGDTDVGVDVADARTGGGAVQFYGTGSFEETVAFGTTLLVSAGSSDVYLAAFASSGDPVWAVRAGGSSQDVPSRINVDGNGDIVMTGYFVGTTTFGATPLTSNGIQDVFVAKYGSNGTVLWARGFGGSTTDIGYGICTDSARNVYATGFFEGTVDFGGGPVAAQARDAFVVKYNADGVFQWVRIGGGASTDRGSGLACDASGGVVMVAAFADVATFGTTDLTSEGGSDIAVVRYDGSGDVRWARGFGGPGADFPSDIAAQGARVFITGGFLGTAQFGTATLTSAGGSADMFLVQLDDAGRVVSVARGGGNSSDFGVGVDHAGATIVVGSFEGSALFGGTQLDSEGETDAFIYRQ